jgi:hypothetical protein
MDLENSRIPAKAKNTTENKKRDSTECSLQEKKPKTTKKTTMQKKT